jgi:plastocyanin
MCDVGTDCLDKVCKMGTCQVPTCSDNVKNGQETDVDCGGPSCGPCPLGKKCLDDADCQSTICTGNVCSQINGCDPTVAMDLTGQATVTITFPANNMLAYSPSCIKVTAGTMVTFQGPFANHPLQAGVVQGATEKPAAAGTTPLPTNAGGLASGSSATFTMQPAGTYGYYCDFHALIGMYGAIIVE